MHKKSNETLTLKSVCRGCPVKRCSVKFCKIRWKAPVLESLFNKVAGLGRVLGQKMFSLVASY